MSEMNQENDTRLTMDLDFGYDLDIVSENQQVLSNSNYSSEGITQPHPVIGSGANSLPGITRPEQEPFYSETFGDETIPMDETLLDPDEFLLKQSLPNHRAVLASVSTQGENSTFPSNVILTTPVQEPLNQETSGVKTLPMDVSFHILDPPVFFHESQTQKPLTNQAGIEAVLASGSTQGENSTSPSNVILFKKGNILEQPNPFIDQGAYSLISEFTTPVQEPFIHETSGVKILPMGDDFLDPDEFLLKHSLPNHRAVLASVSTQGENSTSPSNVILTTPVQEPLNHETSGVKTLPMDVSFHILDPPVFFHESQTQKPLTNQAGIEAVLASGSTQGENSTSPSNVILFKKGNILEQPDPFIDQGAYSLISEFTTPVQEPFIHETSGVKILPKGDDFLKHESDQSVQSSPQQPLANQEANLASGSASKPTESLKSAVHPFPPKKVKAETMNKGLEFDVKPAFSNTNASLHYSEILKKVYVQRKKSFPLEFVYNEVRAEELGLNGKFIVRAIFTNKVYPNAIIKRCVQHQDKAIPSRGVLTVKEKQANETQVIYWPPDDALNSMQEREVIIQLKQSGQRIYFELECWNYCFKKEQIQDDRCETIETSIVFKLETTSGVYGKNLISTYCAQKPKTRGYDEDMKKLGLIQQKKTRKSSPILMRQVGRPSRVVSRSDTARSGTARAGTSRAGTSRAGTSRAGTSRAGTSRALTSRPGTSRPDSPQPGTSRSVIPCPGSLLTPPLSDDDGLYELRVKVPDLNAAYIMAQKVALDMEAAERLAADEETRFKYNRCKLDAQAQAEAMRLQTPRGPF